MKTKIKNATFLAALMSVTVGYSQVGINTNNPQNTLDVNGWVKVGNQNNLQGTSAEGSLRYNTIKKCLELYDGNGWNCIGQPTTQEFLIRDGIDNTISTNGSSNYINESTSGYGSINTITVNNVTPGCKILFLIEITLGTKNRINATYLNSFKIYGNGVFKEFDLPNSANKDSASFFVWGTPNNTSMTNLNFFVESNMSYYNLKITSIIYK